jgi:glycolate oxidase
VDQAVERILKYTVSVGGTITGEHGVGIAKRAYLRFEQPEPLIQLQRSMKHFFDPSGLLNPGKIFPPPKG